MIVRLRGLARTRPTSDTEFLPAALEILETPASPVCTALIWFICLLASAALLWSYLGKVDIVATAQGKIQPAGRVKVVQPLETSRTIAIPVSNGDVVKAGDILVEMDDTALNAETNALAKTLSALQAERVRRDAEIRNVERWVASGLDSGDHRIASDLLVFGSSIPETIRERERSAFAADLAELIASLDNLAAKSLQKRVEIEHLDITVAAERALIDTLAERVEMRSQLVDLHAGTRASVIDALESRQKEHAMVTLYAGQLAGAKSELDVLKSEAAKLVGSFIAENVSKRSEDWRQIDNLEQELVKAKTRQSAMTIRSPIDGIVQASSITTVGQVLSAGSELMRIVPVNLPLEIEAYLPNRDVGFVAAGEPAIIKVEAFPFTRYGVLNGHVTRVATDAVAESDAQQLEASPAQELKSVLPIGNVQRMQNLVFPITIRPDAATIEVGGKPLPLSPGMSVTVEVRTGARSILEYLFSPLAEIGSEALKER